MVHLWNSNAPQPSKTESYRTPAQQQVASKTSTAGQKLVNQQAVRAGPGLAQDTDSTVLSTETVARIAAQPGKMRQWTATPTTSIAATASGSHNEFTAGPLRPASDPWAPPRLSSGGLQTHLSRSTVMATSLLLRLPAPKQCALRHTVLRYAGCWLLGCAQLHVPAQGCHTQSGSATPLGSQLKHSAPLRQLPALPEKASHAVHYAQWAWR